MKNHNCDSFKSDVVACLPKVVKANYFFPQEGTTKVIYAYHPDDPPSENDIPRHNPRSRGTKSLMLLNSMEKIPSMPSDAKTLEFVNNEVGLLEH